jgi:hypothetical protein
MKEQWGRLDNPKLKPPWTASRGAGRPVGLLSGLGFGLALAFLIAVFFWPAAPFVAFVMGAGLLLGSRTASFGTGMVAAGCGVLAFLGALAVLSFVF